VLIVEDPDAPGGNFVHWSVSGLPPSTRAFDEDDVPSGGRIGENSSGNKRWGGPCPPEGDEPHRYVFLLYAMEEPTGLRAGATPEQVRDEIAENAIARGRLEARYGR
jgi:Raf kinase inhibitor-like YbhB/YbcL family protein